MQLDQDFCTAISLFYSAILNYKREFYHEKNLKPGNEDDNFSALGFKIPKLLNLENQGIKGIIFVFTVLPFFMVKLSFEF